MTLKKLPGAVALLASITLLPTVSFAQQPEQKQRREGAQTKQGAGSGERAQPRKEVAPPRAETAAPPRTEARRDDGRSRGNPNGEVQRAVPRNEAVRRGDVQAPRGNQPSIVAPRVVPRYGYDRRDVYRGYDRGRYSYAPRLNYGSRGYYRPYVFRPRFSIGPCPVARSDRRRVRGPVARSLARRR